MKIDPSRLAHLSQVRSREMGAITKMTDDCNALNHRRNAIRARIAQLEHSRDPASVRQQHMVELAVVETSIISARAALDAARERSTAAGQLHRDCERFVENKGRVA